MYIFLVKEIIDQLSQISEIGLILSPEDSNIWCDYLPS